MSRTFRRPSHKLYKGLKKVKDGSRTRVAYSCENHGGCPYCTQNRLYQKLKHLSLKETLNLELQDVEE